MTGKPAGNPAPGYAKKPDHRVDVAPYAGRVAVTLGGEVIADSGRALLVEETGYRPVYYVPEADVRMDLAAPGDADSYCPFKGKASYHSFRAGGRDAANAAWSYDAPYDEAAALKGHLAFYESRVDAVTAS